MSTPPLPPDRPTERVPVVPAEPVALAPHERVVETVPVDSLLAQLAEDVRSLRTWLTALTVLTLLTALGAGYAIYKAREADDRAENSASRGRVAALDRRVDRLSQGTADAAEQTDVQGVARTQTAQASEIATLRRQVASLRESVSDAAADADSGSGADASADVTALEERVDTLSQQVQDLREGGSGAETP